MPLAWWSLHVGGRSLEFRVSIDNSVRFVEHWGLGLWHLKMAAVQYWKEVARLVGTPVGNGKEGRSYLCQVQVLPSVALQGGDLVVPLPGTGLGALTYKSCHFGPGSPGLKALVLLCIMPAWWAPRDCLLKESMGMEKEGTSKASPLACLCPHLLLRACLGSAT